MVECQVIIEFRMPGALENSLYRGGHLTALRPVMRRVEMVYKLLLLSKKSQFMKLRVHKGERVTFY